MRYANWKIPAPAEVPERLTAQGYSPLLSAVLALRGYGRPEDAREFLEGGRAAQSDPLMFQDMTDAVRRLTRAISTGEHVAVYGDYDVDGITSVVLLKDYLESRGLKCEHYIPKRKENEPYGVNNDAVRRLAEMGVTLIVTVDCGITNQEQVEYARSLGVDMIITDHHQCQDELPDAVAVVDPNRPEDTQGKELAGVGVAFKLVCAMDGDADKMLRRYGDLVAAGTVADVMPMRGENRYYTRVGLKMIQDGSCREGFSALLRESSFRGGKVTAGTISYMLAPRINAAGRVGNVEDALDLLRTRDAAGASRLAATLQNNNIERQRQEREIWEEARHMLGDAVPDTAIVLASDGWASGVIGIVASRLADAYSVPTVMLRTEGDVGKGSCRSVGNFNLFEALTACSDCLEGFGGHAMAAGVSVRRDRIDEFRQRLGDYYRGHPDRSEPCLEPDLAISDPAFLTEACVRDLDRLEPCGNGNPRPLFYMEDLTVRRIDGIGAGKHSRLKLAKQGAEYTALFFGQSPEKLALREGDRTDVVFAPQVNEFRGETSIQLVLTDIRHHR